MRHRAQSKPLDPRYPLKGFKVLQPENAWDLCERLADESGMSLRFVRGREMLVMEPKS